MAQQLEALVIDQIRDIAAHASEEVIDAEDLVSFIKQAPADISSQKSGTTRDEDSLLPKKHDVSFNLVSISFRHIYGKPAFETLHRRSLTNKMASVCQLSGATARKENRAKNGYAKPSRMNALAIGGISPQAATARPARGASRSLIIKDNQRPADRGEKLTSHLFPFQRRTLP
jgi:hypothetical protein